MTDLLQQVKEAMEFAETALSHERVCRDCAEGGCLTVDADGRHGCPDCTNDEAQARLRALSSRLDGMRLVPEQPTEAMSVAGCVKPNLYPELVDAVYRAMLEAAKEGE